MNKNLISSDDVDLLFDKLVSGNLVIIAVLSSLIGFRLQFTGILDKNSTVREGILIRRLPLATEHDSLMVPLFKRKVEFSYCDPRDIPPGLEVVASKTGNTVLMFRFFDSSKPAETLETLIFFFTI